MTMQRFSRYVYALLFSIFYGAFFFGGALHAQTKTASPPTGKYLSSAEEKALYRNCEGGWYSGPRPGKTRFTQDPWMWVVTPEFAQRMCIPEEFVSAELKGAEAVAFRLLSDNDEVNCGFGNNPQACSGRIVLRFDIYIKNSVDLSKQHQEPYYQSVHTPSKMLLTPSLQEDELAQKERKHFPEVLARTAPFFYGQVALQGVKDGVVQWPITTLIPETLYASVFSGIDYYAFEGLSGFFNNPRMMKAGIRKFHISFRKKGNESERSAGMSVSKFQHVIELPEAFSEKIAEMDRQRGRNIEKDVRNAFGVNANLNSGSP